VTGPAEFWSEIDTLARAPLWTGSSERELQIQAVKLSDQGTATLSATALSQSSRVLDPVER
jgi:hypothetical protein